MSKVFEDQSDNVSNLGDIGVVFTLIVVLGHICNLFLDLGQKLSGFISFLLSMSYEKFRLLSDPISP